jgi:polysaccharide export outer membrane protein
MTTHIIRIATLALIVTVASASVWAQQAPPKPTPAQSKQPQPLPVVEPDYRIGASDVLTINVWNEKDLSGDVVVRPDGKISMPVGKEIMALGLKPEELKVKLMEELGNFFKPAPEVYIVVKQINSRIVFITGAVGKPGPYPLSGAMTVLHLITTAGGVLEFADKKNVMLISGTLKDKAGQPLSYKINYKDLIEGKNLAKNNIELRPGDTVVVR